MSGASSCIPYKGILAGLCIIAGLAPADAITGYDCETILVNMTIHLENQDPDTRERLKSNMKFGSEHPDEFAYQYKGGPGYMAVMEEDKFHILQCSPVEVELKRQDKCYNRLEILRGDQSLFMTPWTHIITKTATELPCNSALLQYAELDLAVYKVVPRPEGSSSILRLKPSTKLTWKYEEIPNLWNSGIYSEQEINDWQLRQQHPEQFNPPPVLYQPLPDANGNVPGVIYLNRAELKGRWYETWNMNSVLALVSISVFGILATGCIVKIISNRRRQRTESDDHDLTNKLYKFEDVRKHHQPQHCISKA